MSAKLPQSFIVNQRKKMIDIIVKVAGSVFCLGVGVALLAFGLMMLSAFFVEIYGRVFRAK